MKNKDLIDRLAKLESVNDQLTAELRYLDQLARALGFDGGLETLKQAAIELLESTQEEGRDLPPSN